MELDALDRKLNEAFAGKVVRKDLLHQIKGGENIPSYVLEYLLGRYCASDSDEEIQLGISAVKDTLRKNYFRQDEANKAKALVERHGRHRFIDRINVRFAPSETKYWAEMDNFGYQHIHIADEFHRRYDRLLEGGMRARVDVEARQPEETGKGASPFHVTHLKPIQLARFDFEEFCNGRRSFTTDQWIDTRLRSIGLEPDRFDRRRKILLVTRLLAMVEKGYNFIELGPRGTGKSYAYSEFTPYAILLSGGKASTANLFYNNARRQVGLVGHWDVVAFDEVGGMKVSDADTLQIMKDYMANGRFSRGITQVHADASIVFVGNLNHPIEILVSNSAMDLFQPLPKEFDLALIDRLHFYLPGWEVPKNSPELLTNHYGFVTDYLAEALHTLRKDNRFDALNSEFRLGAHVEGRDASSIRRTVSGLLKLLHPHGEWTRDELRAYLELAMEGRRRVKEQLKKRGSFEFYRTSFSYIEENDGREVTVGVPEQGGEGAISRDALAPGATYTATVDGESRVSLLRIEVTASPGTGKLRTPAGMARGLKESLNRAWAYLQSVKENTGLSAAVATKDFAAESVDLSGGGAEAECGVAFFVAIMSALQNRSVEGDTVILGDLTIQGNIKAPASIAEPLQVALDNGALRALVPVANKKQVALLPEEVVEKLDIVFFGDVNRAVVKGLMG